MASCNLIRGEVSASRSGEAGKMSRDAKEEINLTNTHICTLTRLQAYFTACCEGGGLRFDEIFLKECHLIRRSSKRGSVNSRIKNKKGKISLG